MKKPKRRGNGQGTVYRRGRTYTAVKTKFVRGKRLTMSKGGFKTTKEAAAWLNGPKIEKIDIPLIELCEKWLSTFKASESTINCYKAGLKIFEKILYYPMSEIEIDELQRIIDNAKKGYRTKENAKTALNLIYKYGIPRGYVPDNLNLAAFIKIKSKTASNKRGFTDTELRKIKNAVGSVPFADMVYCHCYLGFRPTAFLALKKSDFNQEEKTLRGGIKTEAGINRIVTISPKIIPLVEKRAKDIRPEEYIFGIDGKQLNGNQYRSIFSRLLKQLNITEIDKDGKKILTPHSCRHTFATLMKKVNAPDKDKLALIGHTKTEMLRHYQDIDLNDLKAITDCM